MQAHAAVTGEHRVHDFRGTPFEIGVQHGRALREQIRHDFRRVSQQFAAQSGRAVDAVVDRYFDAVVPLFRGRCPCAVEEIEGLAEGCGLTYAEAFLISTCDGFKGADHPSACTAFACGSGTTADGHILMGQNKDAGLSTDRYHIMRMTYASGRRMILLNYPGWIANIGLTSDGLCFTGNSRYAERPAGGTVPYSLLKRLVLEKRSVDEVLHAIDGLIFENGAFLVGDSTGRIVCIECVAGRVEIRDVSDRAFGHANSVLADSLKQFESKTLGSPSSPMRQESIQKRLDEKRGAITADDMKGILANHAGFPMSVCKHSCEADAHHSTAAFVADLTALHIEIAIGNPCAAEFEKYGLAS